MAVQSEDFGVLPDGRAVRRITLDNGKNTAVSVLTYGATLQSFRYGDKDIVLGYDCIDDYLHANGSYIGATIGRVCNRIGAGRFTLNGENYQLNCNEIARGCHLHGGNVGFDKKIWDAEILSAGDQPAVRFSLFSPDGEENYPGNLNVSVTYALDAQDTLSLTYEAESDRDTIVNFTNHSYFNLNGYDGGDVRNTLLRIDADAITVVDDGLIPTGELMPVDGTPFDLRQAHTIGEAVGDDHPMIRAVDGIDHNFALNGETGQMRDVTWAYSPATGIRVTCSTDLPGIQIYTGNCLDEEHGKGGLCWKQYGGFCMETQMFPDAVNHPGFASTVLRAGEKFRSRTAFRVDREPMA